MEAMSMSGYCLKSRSWFPGIVGQAFRLGKACVLLASHTKWTSKLIGQVRLRRSKWSKSITRPFTSEGIPSGSTQKKTFSIH
jgi:hypothetical protein